MAFRWLLMLQPATSAISVPGVGDTTLRRLRMLVRPFPVQSPNWPNDPTGASTPPTSGIVDILKRGYMTVLLSGLAPRQRADRCLSTSGHPRPIIRSSVASKSATSTSAIAASCRQLFHGTSGRQRDHRDRLQHLSVTLRALTRRCCAGPIPFHIGHTNEQSPCL